jgi:hypothetical protein
MSAPHISSTCIGRDVPLQDSVLQQTSLQRQ